MADLLWKRLTVTDFNGMSGSAAVSDSGGGARHIAIGVSKAGNDVDSFLPPGHGERVKVPTQMGPAWPASALTFATQAERRGGEWRISDQKNNRHPAWTEAAGFPASFDAANRPVILVIKADEGYHVAWLDEPTLDSLAPALQGIEKGVAACPPKLLGRLGLDRKSALQEFVASEGDVTPPPFDPADQDDARRRTLAEIVRRQGQRAFRKELMANYGGACAITGCSVSWVLEAAHISPYRGPATNRADNGLLLRADLHTLFDLGLLTIEPSTLLVRVSQQIVDPDYRFLDGLKLRVSNSAPSKAALEEHWSRSTP